MSYKRINLSFDLRRGRDAQAYVILSSKKHKTDYVVDLLLNKEGIDNQNISKEVIKEALREVLEEMNINININKSNQDIDEEIPEEIFDIFGQL